MSAAFECVVWAAVGLAVWLFWRVLSDLADFVSVLLGEKENDRPD